MREPSASAAEGSTRIAEARRSDGVLRAARSGTEWLHTGWNGGRVDADVAYNVTVPDGWDPDDLAAYVEDRLANAGFEAPGPTLLTGVSMRHARGASCGPVTVVATAGFSNPAALPATPSGGDLPDAGDHTDPEPGTVNLIVVTDRALADGALANLVAVAAEAKAATLLDATGFPGTTTDAITVGHDPNGPETAFSGSATAVGAATRAAVRGALRATLRSRYAEESPPDSVAEARHGVSTDARATVFAVDPDDA
ncbi:adenosylcobinamide amidohydrolase [Halovivax limisalsi]|uniref:adenosylcobinamide amidohydrolase n=1 Tax=Halovivax limisalsi TaxID=1453760 RepID=UPI001FFC3CF1|nr:adenosylcobinamide amidohydrolase [Halovivax limisalsi]